MTSPPPRQEHVHELTTPCPWTLEDPSLPPPGGTVLGALACCVPLIPWQLKLLFLFPPAVPPSFYLILVYRGSQYFSNKPTEEGQGLNPHPHGYESCSIPLSHNGNSSAENFKQCLSSCCKNHFRQQPCASRVSDLGGKYTEPHVQFPD